MSQRLSAAPGSVLKKTPFELQQMVNDLQEEVACLKKKLDELRRAKCTTIVKREREILRVGHPFVARNSKLEKPNDASPKTQSENNVCDKQTEENLVKCPEALKTELVDEENTSPVDLDSISLEGEEQEENTEYIKSLLERIDQLNDENMALTVQNKTLEDDVTDLKMELNKKEMEWCKKEEQLKSTESHIFCREGTINYIDPILDWHLFYRPQKNESQSESD
ncbi:uncharacterized protein LOC106878128 [Octopus bimaculoides]|uniref:Uncharacterized protein n=1 Tax=Octopus bimaculoides TaxID=37653 RepID=A0A0L8GAQ7_OCTBM|nr:uncharacterized protein LOC106878128 [Octopus bimaculoides]|eukprot:XP_014782735.1 PREDICTED: uncharacterized protein LOC106878128 [Octopus bimaculoides]